MRVTAVLSEAFSQKVGGQSVGGFMKTALANNQGQLVVTLRLVTGTFSNPRFCPTSSNFAQMIQKAHTEHGQSAPSPAHTEFPR